MAKSIAQFLGAWPSLEELRITSEYIMAEGAKALGAAWAKNRGNVARIRTLDLRNNDLRDPGIAALVDGILSRGQSQNKNNSHPQTRLRILLLDTNKIHAEGWSKVTELLAASPRLQCVGISQNVLGSLGGTLLSGSVKSYANSLVELNVFNCGLGSAGISQLCKALAGSAVYSLIIDNNAIGDSGAETISDELLAKSPTLTRLTLCYNELTEKGAQRLARGICGNLGLRSLDLSFNALGPRGASAILVAVRTSRVNTLRLSGCDLGDEGAREVARFIQDPGCVRDIDVGRNAIHESGIAEIAAAVEIGDVITALNIGCNFAKRKGTEVVADLIIRRSRVMRKLNILDIWMGDEGAKKVANAVCERNKSSALEQVVVGLQDCKEAGAAALLRAREEVGSLLELSQF